MQSPDDDPFLAAAFLEQFLRDQEAGQTGACSDYQRRFPGNDSLIARQYEALTTKHPAALDATPSDADHRTVAHYELLDEIGRGGQGVVYRARDMRLGRVVALKVLHRGALATEQAQLRFRREAEVAARLDHPGISTVLDTGVDEHCVYIAMRFVAGQTLANVFAEMTAPPGNRTEFEHWAGIFERTARALHAAHEAGVVHRDITPGNIMLAANDQPVVLDFGLARGDDHSGPTQTGDVFGTPSYIAPEQLLGDQRNVTAQCDVYSLGATLFEFLTRRPPFAESSRESLYRAILELEPPSPQTLNRAVPADLAIIALTALSKDRRDRYRNAAALADDLARFVARQPIKARPATAPLRAWRWAQRNRTIAVLSVLLFAVLSVSIAVLVSQNVRLQNSLVDARAGRLTKQQMHVQDLVERGYQLVLGADARGAEHLFDEALAIDPANDHAFVGRVFCDIEQPMRALDTLLDRRPRLETAPESCNPDLIWLRDLLASTARPGAEHLVLPPEDGRGFSDLRCYLRGLALFLHTFGDPDDPRNAATLWFRRAVQRAPRPLFHYVHGWLMAARSNNEAATMDEAAELLELHWPDHPATHEAIAQFYLGSDPERAERSMRRLLVLRPHSALPHCGLAALATTREDLQEALRHYDRAIAAQSDFTPAWQMRASLKLQIGDTEGARTDLEQCLRQDRNHVPAIAALAQLMADTGEREAAIGLLQRTLATNPDNKMAVRMLQPLLARLRG